LERGDDPLHRQSTLNGGYMMMLHLRLFTQGLEPAS
jgi:hypothetical protein